MKTVMTLLLTVLSSGVRIHTYNLTPKKRKTWPLTLEKLPNTLDSVIIKEKVHYYIEKVQSFKYRGTIIDSTLNCKQNCEAVYKRGHQCLFCLRKLSRFHIEKTMMTVFYRAFSESVLAFSLVSWFGNLSLKEQNSLNQIIKWSSRLIGEPQLSLESLYSRQLQQIASSILSDDSHPLVSEFQHMPLGRRLRVPRSKTTCYRNSFAPTAVSFLDKSLCTS